MNKRNYIKQAKIDCLELGLSQHEISCLIDKDPKGKTEKLIELFNETADDDQKRKVLTLLYRVGDEEDAGNFLAALYETANLTAFMKFWIAILGKLGKFNAHPRLCEVLDAHLKGESPAKVFLRALYPDGRTCRVRKNLAAADGSQTQSAKGLKATKRSVKIQTEKPTGK